MTCDGRDESSLYFNYGGHSIRFVIGCFCRVQPREPRGSCSFWEKEKLKESLEMVKYESVSIYYAEEDRTILELTKETLQEAADMNRELFASPLQDSVDLIFFQTAMIWSHFQN